MLIKQLDADKLSNRLTMLAMQKHRPLSCTFELTYRCNFRCPMCYIRMTDEQAAPFGRLRTVDEWLDMARQIYDAGVLYLTLTGGECTQYPGFAQLYEAVSRMGFRVSLMSNAGAYSPALRELFRAYPPYGVAVTLYGGSNETYAAVTGDPRGLDKVLENIRFLQSIRVPVGINFTMIRQNVADYPKVAQIAASLGIGYTINTDITPHARCAAYSDTAGSALSIAQRACIACRSIHEVDAALADAVELEKELAHFELPTRQAPAEAVRSCIGSYTAAAIYWNGDMNTCISLSSAPSFKPFEIGFEAAWQQMVATHAERFHKPDVCLHCGLADECQRNCAGRFVEGTGDPQTPDTAQCQYTWLVHKYREQHESTGVAVQQSC